MTAQPDRAEMVLGKLLSDTRFTLASLARAMGISEPQIKAYRYGRQRFPAELVPDLWEAVAEVDPALADWALAEIVGLARIGKRLATRLPADRDPVLTDLVKAAEHLGHAQGETLRAGPTVEPHEAPVILAPLRRSYCEQGEAIAKLERIAAASPQRALPMAEGR